MAQKWSVTKSAINSYGDKMLKLHPEYWEAPPYAQATPAKTMRGSGLIKGSKEAKARMAYLRSLRGKGSYNKAALKGGKSYNKAALKGGSSYTKAALKGGSSYTKAALKGGFDLGGVGDYLNTLRDTFGTSVHSITDDVGKQVMDFASDPERIRNTVMKVAKPVGRSLFQRLKDFIKRKRDKRRAARGGSILNNPQLLRAIQNSRRLKTY